MLINLNYQDKKLLNIKTTSETLRINQRVRSSINLNDKIQED